MQPPPMRKGPYLKVLTNVHKEQIARLQAKNQHECDLLEDIRSFTKQRSAIEKSYAEALLKISNAYLNKKIPSIPDLRDDDGDEQWNVWNVWRTVLEENEKLGKARLAAVEVFQQQITDDAKAVRQVKLSSSRKCLDQLSVIQKEVQYSVAELDRNKKLYFEEEHLAHDVRDRMKKKKGSIFSSLTSLKRESVKRAKGKEDQKVSSKKDACEEKSTGARNDYLIALAIANAHQDHYYNVDLDGTLKSLEAEVYSKLKEYLTVLSRTELLTCSAAQNSFSKIRDQAQRLSREYNVMCCVQYYPVLKQHIRYPFEPCDGDSCTKITCDHGAGAILSREAKRWATKIGKEVKTAKESQKKLNSLQQMRDAGNKADPDDPNGPDLETKIEELRDIIRRALAEKAKAEGVIECLRDGDVNVDEWMQDIENLTIDMARSASSTSIKTEDGSRVCFMKVGGERVEASFDSDLNDTSENREGETSSAEPPEREEDIEAQFEMERKKIEALSAMTWDDPIAVDWGDAAAEEPEPTPPPNVEISQDHSHPHYEITQDVAGIKCVAIYTYEAANPDELSIVENEHLELMGDPGDEESGWVRARNYKGEEGYVPQNYVEVEAEVDYHVQEKAVPTTEDVTEEGRMKASGAISNGYMMDQNEDENQNLPQDGTPTVPTSVSSGLTTPFINELRHGDVGEFCRALYDYEATAPEEISFSEGQIVKILRRDYDGWWEGEYDGMTGVFPEIVVEECRWDGEPLSPMDEDDEIDEDDISDSGILPPCYTPPEIPSHLLPPEKVVVTQPTPEIERSDEHQPHSEDDMVEPPRQRELGEDTDEEEDQIKQPVEKSASSTSTQAAPPPPVIEPPAIAVESSSSSSFGFEMELSGDRQRQYQANFTSDSTRDPEIVVTEMPGIMVTMEPDDPDHEEEAQGGDSGLDVAQIVITAATPMTDDHVPLPGESSDKGVEGEGADPPTAEEDVVDHATAPATTAAEPVQADQSKNSPSDESNEEEEVPDYFPRVPTQPPPPPPQKEATPEEEEEDGGGGGGGWAAFDDNFPKDPISSVPRVVEVEVKETKIEPKKASLDIDEKEKARISLGESNESPVTPEELDVQNLAKLESLKESDA
ncbi:protein nervous wreck-like isoform X3 [Folsomia candida]|uniref:protein nervous wreck-like isoform X3 n=1 Tax=Folsomia candida TaxID=158441 RepID=UPI00160507E7|nr:protein nervous wreck-like isoform X3 [Folsomia candida]